MKLMYNMFIYLILICIVVYLYVMLSFRYRPTSLTGIKYKVTSTNKITDFDDKNYIYIVNHEDPVYSDIVIMSNEVNYVSTKFNFVSGGSAGGIVGDPTIKPSFYKRYSPYLTKYNIIWTSDGNTIKKCKERYNKKENVLFFLKKEHKGKGIHYLIKDTKSEIILVHKVNHSESFKDINSKNKLFKMLSEMRKMNYDIQYEKISIDTDNLTPEQTLDHIKSKLYKEYKI